jgi:hypothetical protein
MYLLYSMGTVWGAAFSSTIIQNNLTYALRRALSNVPEKDKVRLSPVSVIPFLSSLFIESE